MTFLDGDGVVNLDDCSPFDDTLLFAPTNGDCGWVYDPQTGMLQAFCDDIDTLFGSATELKLAVGSLDSLQATGNTDDAVCAYTSPSPTLEFTDTNPLESEYFLWIFDNACSASPQPPFDGCE